MKQEIGLGRNKKSGTEWTEKVRRKGVIKNKKKLCKGGRGEGRFRSVGGNMFWVAMRYVKRISLTVAQYKNCCWSGMAPRNWWNITTGSRNWEIRALYVLHAVWDDPLSTRSLVTVNRDDSTLQCNFYTFSSNCVREI
jgi:hypothetical protein